MDVVDFTYGDTLETTWQLTDANDTPIDLTGCTVTFAVASPAGTPLFQQSSTASGSAVTIPNPTNGTISVAVPPTATGAQKVNPDGTVSYQGTTSTYIAGVTFTGLTEAAILIGNGAVSDQNVFDASETALVTSAGLTWLAGGLSDLSEFISFGGNYFFMSHNWRIKAATSSCPNASVQAYLVSADGQPLDVTNGSVGYLSNTTAQQLVIALLSAVNSGYSAGSVGAQLLTIFNNAAIIPALLSKA